MVTFGSIVPRHTWLVPPTIKMYASGLIASLKSQQLPMSAHNRKKFTLLCVCDQWSKTLGLQTLKI